MTKAELLTLLDETIANLEASENHGEAWAINNSGTLPICRRHGIECTGCPANEWVSGSPCWDWESRSEEIVYFGFVRAQVELGR